MFSIRCMNYGHEPQPVYKKQASDADLQKYLLEARGLPQAVFTQKLQSLQFSDDDVVQVQIERIAYGRQIEKIASHFLFQKVAAVITQCPFDVRMHMILHIVHIC